MPDRYEQPCWPERDKSEWLEDPEIEGQLDWPERDEDEWLDNPEREEPPA